MNVYPWFAAVCLLATVGCVAADPKPEPAIRTLAKGAFSGIDDARTEVIKDREGLEKVWAQLSVRNKPSPEMPSVDFLKEMVILATLGEQRTGGHSIEISKVETSPDRLLIHIKRITPKPGSMNLQALTSPFHLAAIPRSELKPQFVNAK